MDQKRGEVHWRLSPFFLSTVERPVSKLAACASTELHFFKPVPATKRISISLIRADYGNKVVESDESNNKWGK